MFISLCTKFCQVMLLFHFTTSYLEYGDEEKILDMDDLMKVRYKSPRRFITPYEDINPKYFNIKDNDALLFNIKNNPEEENSIPITVDLDNGLQAQTVHDHSEKNSVQTKDDPTIKKLEDLVLHPLWLTLPKQRLKCKTTEINNIKEPSDIDSIHKLQERVKDNLCNTARVKKIWGKSDESDDIIREKVNNLQTNNESNDFAYENQLVLRTLNNFYARLFNTIAEVVPSLKFEDPFMVNYLTKQRLNFNHDANMESPASPSDFNRNTLGQYIEKKLEHLKKEPVEKTRYPEIVTLSKILHHIPSILFMNISDKDKDDRLFKMDKATIPMYNEINDRKIIKYPVSDNNFLQYIPQIRYSFDIDKNATNLINKNKTSTTMWYYSNFYTEAPPPTKVTTTNIANLTEEKITTQSSVQWLSPNNENVKFYNKIPNLGHLLRSSDMSRRIEWENMDEMIGNVETTDTDDKQELIRTTESNQAGNKIADQSKWFKNPLKNYRQYYFNDADLNNKNNLKCEGKFCDLVKNAYELVNGKYSLLYNQH